ncbi:hypothetical protein DL764_006131 [Monosporascus ibericus]|uniref:DUF4048 domain-containing protein n=1 Tax=Monosporascus ibericus TaxID=155417 RepID=A0A4Q4T5S7_9PEZI|nr:hypothetical protein DL764_006131 [Monosporascus ibericus]
MAFQQNCRHRGSSNPTTSLDAVLASSSAEDRSATTTATDEQVQVPAPPFSPTHVGWTDQPSRDGRQTDKEPGSVSMPSPSAPSETRSARSTSSASRNSNRLSLTLPIAPPNSLPSRPVPTPTSSVPPTPCETSAVAFPADPNELIIAIAAQERRVLELKEELVRAEGELVKLKKQFTAAEAYKKRTSGRRCDPLRVVPSPGPGLTSYEDTPVVNRSTELERRKAILLAQSQGTLRDHKRTVISGGHTRTLSLLSPTKPTAEFPLHEDPIVRRSVDSPSGPDWRPKTATALNKRATWAPRQTQQSNGVKQIANDFKQGLWTFVEDLRQATVGDEAITGKFNRTSDMALRLNRDDGDQDTIRAPAGNRGRVPFPVETSSETITTTKSSSPSPGSFTDRVQHRRTTSKASETTKARKHFSWTPLTFDQFDDDDWSNWDTPTSKQSRWSGSTVNGDIIPAIPEKLDETEATLRRKRSHSELRSASQSPSAPTSQSTASATETSPPPANKLDDLPQALLHRLSPGNIKRTAADFMREWEKSLSPPPETTAFEETHAHASAVP